MQMNGTEDARAAIKEALGLENSADLVNGLSALFSNSGLP